MNFSPVRRGTSAPGRSRARRRLRFLNVLGLSVIDFDLAMSCISLLLFLLLSPPAFAQSTPTPPVNQAAASTPKITAYTLPPDKLRKSEALYHLGLKILTLGTLYSWLVLVFILYSGLAARYRDWAELASSQRIVQAAIFVPLLLITLALAALPLRIYGHHIGLQYGLSVQGWGSWFVDYAKSEGIDILVFIILLWIMQTIIRRSPRRWWFYFWLAILPIILFVVFIQPLVIDPLFNKFELLQNTNPRLVEAIEKIEQRAGVDIPRDHLFEMKASEKVTVLNAYVTGFGASKRVVIWDTTIQKTTLPETLAVVGHEMGHYVLHHILKGMVAGAIGLLIGLFILFHLATRTVQHFGPRWGIRALDDWAAFPMIFLLAAIMGFFAEPVGNSFSRHIEHQADIYGLEVTHGVVPDSQQVAAQSFQVLGELSLEYPYPNRLEVFWFSTHPPTSDRLRFALEYDPWGKGAKAKYVH